MGLLLPVDISNKNFTNCFWELFQIVRKAFAKADVRNLVLIAKELLRLMEQSKDNISRRCRLSKDILDQVNQNFKDIISLGNDYLDSASLAVYKKLKLKVKLEAIEKNLRIFLVIVLPICQLGIGCNTAESLETLNTPHQPQTSSYQNPQPQTSSYFSQNPQNSQPQTSNYHCQNPQPQTASYHYQNPQNLQPQALNYYYQNTQPQTSNYHYQNPQPQTSSYHYGNLQNSQPQASNYYYQNPQPQISSYHYQNPQPQTSNYHYQNPQPQTSSYHYQDPQNSQPQTWNDHSQNLQPQTLRYENPQLGEQWPHYWIKTDDTGIHKISKQYLGASDIWLSAHFVGEVTEPVKGEWHNGVLRASTSLYLPQSHGLTRLISLYMWDNLAQMCINNMKTGDTVGVYGKLETHPGPNENGYFEQFYKVTVTQIGSTCKKVEYNAVPYLWIENADGLIQGINKWYVGASEIFISARFEGTLPEDFNYDETNTGIWWAWTILHVNNPYPYGVRSIRLEGRTEEVISCMQHLNRNNIYSVSGFLLPYRENGNPQILYKVIAEKLSIVY